MLGDKPDEMKVVSQAFGLGTEGVQRLGVGAAGRSARNRAAAASSRQASTAARTCSASLTWLRPPGRTTSMSRSTATSSWWSKRGSFSMLLTRLIVLALLNAAM